MLPVNLGTSGIITAPCQPQQTDVDEATGNSVSHAIRIAIDRFDVDPLEEPERALAIVADLTGEPGRSSAESMGALRSTLRVLAAQTSPLNATRRADCLEEITASGTDPDDAASMLDLVVDVVAFARADADQTGPNMTLRFVGLAVLVVAIGIFVVFRVRSSPTSSTTTTPPVSTFLDDEATPTVEPPDTDSEPNLEEDDESASVENLLIANFEPAADGDFLVEREWRVGAGEIVAITRLSNPGTNLIAGLHREFPPPAPGATPDSVEWLPVPTNLIATTAVYSQITLDAGQVFEIVYRSATAVTSPTEQDVLDWYEAWKPQAEGLNSVLGPSADFAPPVIRVE